MEIFSCRFFRIVSGLARDGRMLVCNYLIFRVLVTVIALLRETDCPGARNKVFRAVSQYELKFSGTVPADYGRCVPCSVMESESQARSLAVGFFYGRGVNLLNLAACAEAVSDGQHEAVLRGEREVLHFPPLAPHGRLAVIVEQVRA